MDYEFVFRVGPIGLSGKETSDLEDGTLPRNVTTTPGPTGQVLDLNDQDDVRRLSRGTAGINEEKGKGEAPSPVPDKDDGAAPVPPKPKPNTRKFKLVELIEVYVGVDDDIPEGAVIGAAPANKSGEYSKIFERELFVDSFKQYINLEIDDREDGKRHPDHSRWIALRARIEWADGGKSDLAGKKIRWSFTETPHSESGRPAQLTADQSAGFEPDGRGENLKTTMSTTDDKGWTPVVWFGLSEYAGDQFVIHAAAEPAEDAEDNSVKLNAGPYQVWRKFWAQITQLKNSGIPEPYSAIDSLIDVFAELIFVNTVEISREKLGDEADFCIYPQWMLAPPHPVIGDPDSDALLVRAEKETGKLWEFTERKEFFPNRHIVLANKVTYGTILTPLITHPMSSNEEEYTFNGLSQNQIFVNPLEEKFVAYGAWEIDDTGPYSDFFASKGIPVCEPNSSPKNGTSGLIKDEDIIIKKQRSNQHAVTIKLPDDCPDATQHRIVVTLSLRSVRAISGFADHRLNRTAAKYTRDSNHGTQYAGYRLGRTVTHELGHWFNQVPQQPVAPLGSHATAYTGMGGTGRHCHFGATLITRGNPPQQEWSEGECVMFHVNTDNKDDGFCNNCRPFVHLANMTGKNS